MAGRWLRPSPSSGIGSARVWSQRPFPPASPTHRAACRPARWSDRTRMTSQKIQVRPGGERRQPVHLHGDGRPRRGPSTGDAHEGPGSSTPVTGPGMRDRRTGAPPGRARRGRLTTTSVAAAGDSVVATVTVSDAAAQGVVTETLPAGFTYVISSLPDQPGGAT